MNHKIYLLGLIILLIVGCQKQEQIKNTDPIPTLQTTSEGDETLANKDSQLNPNDNIEEMMDSTGMIPISVQVNNQSYKANLFENEATSALIKLFPLTLQLSDLYGNEKYHYLSESLPTHSTSPKQIEKGDLMLFGDNCLVIFYDSFKTPYSYTPLGYLVEGDEFSEVLKLESNTIEIVLSLHD